MSGGLPPLLLAAGIIEVVGGALLFLGLFTRRSLIAGIGYIVLVVPLTLVLKRALGVY